MNKTISMTRIRQASVILLYMEICVGENNLTLFFPETKFDKEHKGFVLAFLQRTCFC